MCRAARSSISHRTLYWCEVVACYVCFHEIGLICNSTDLTLNGIDVVVCGVCMDMHIDQVIEEVLA